jgi:signal transduction histidine kinase
MIQISETAKVQFFAAACLLTVFIINILAPPYIVIDVLYLCSIVLVFKQPTHTILCFSAAACLLIAINVVFFDLEVKVRIFLWINRGISLLAVFVVSYIAIQYNKQTHATLLKEHSYLKALESMLFMTSHEVRKPVANILGLTESMNTDSVDLSADDINEICKHIQASASELDNFIRSLNTFIERTEEEHNQEKIQSYIF